MRTAAKPRTNAEVLATASRFRMRAATIRSLIADPGEGGEVLEQLKHCGPAQVETCEQLATALEAVAAD